MVVQRAPTKRLGIEVVQHREVIACELEFQRQLHGNLKHKQ